MFRRSVAPDRVGMIAFLHELFAPERTGRQGQAGCVAAIASGLVRPAIASR
jgi:hypothetical protein